MAEKWLSSESMMAADSVRARSPVTACEHGVKRAARPDSRNKVAFMSSTYHWRAELSSITLWLGARHLFSRRRWVCEKADEEI